MPFDIASDEGKFWLFKGDRPVGRRPATTEQLGRAGRALESQWVLIVRGVRGQGLDGSDVKLVDVEEASGGRGRDAKGGVTGGPKARC